MPTLRLVVSAALTAAGPAFAAPRVAADIAPVHSIAAAVMAGVGEPVLLVPPGVSEHHYALRPSEAAALAGADLVVWVGPGLTPWLEGPIAALAESAGVLPLTEADGVRLLPARAGGPFEAADHDHAAPGPQTEAGRGAGDDARSSDGAHDDEARPHDHGAGDHAQAGEGADHGHADAGDHADHDGGDAGRGPDGAAAGPAQSTGTVDPHIWLDPANGAAIAGAIASALSAVDPANASAYAANAEAFRAEVAALAHEIAPGLAAAADRPYMVFHDAYQYFETAFGIPAEGSVALNDAEPPRAGRVAEIRARLTRDRVDCVFAEPQFEPKLIATLIEDTDARTGTLDPLGSDLEPGPSLYPALLRGLADDLAACFDAAS